LEFLRAVIMEHIIHPEAGVSTFLGNISEFPPDYVALHTRKPRSSWYMGSEKKRNRTKYCRQGTVLNPPIWERLRGNDDHVEKYSA
jgi:hypothetical protein